MHLSESTRIKIILGLVALGIIWSIANYVIFFK